MKFYLLLFTLLTFSLKSQWLWDFGGRVGASNYLGDIGGKEQAGREFLSDIKLAKTRWNVGGFARWKWRPKISLEASFDYLRVEGDDKLSANPGRRFRNFNFRNDMYELSLKAAYFFYENNDLGNTYRYRNGFRMYLFAGVGGFYSNPKSLYLGEWVAMQPYASEGTVYSKMNFCIPFGGGFYFTFNKRHRFGFEVNLRKTFTDYIDDISGNYPDDPGNDYERGLILRTLLIPEEDPKLMADYPDVYDSHTWGAKRGSPDHKDAYLTMGLSYSYVIRGKSSFYRVRNTGFFNKKRKMRKIRAKF